MAQEFKVTPLPARHLWASLLKEGHYLYYVISYKYLNMATVGKFRGHNFRLGNICHLFNRF
jgi:hypothetical protein